MALVGGGTGGAGNVAGSNPSGIGAGLVYAGNGIWAGWSGLVDPNNTSQEAFNFKSPLLPLTANITWTCNLIELTANRAVGIEVKLNGEVIMHHIGQITANGDFPGSFPNNIGPFVIPSDSEIIVTISTTEDTAVDQYVTIEGRE